MSLLIQHTKSEIKSSKSSNVWNIEDNPKVAVVLVNWQQVNYTLKSVSSLIRQTIQPLIIVVDNGSTDCSIELLSSQLPSGVYLISCESNNGFGSGCNVGIELAISLGADYVWLLNNDAIAKDDCLQRMLALISPFDLTGVVGANIIDPTGLVVNHAGSLLNGTTFSTQYTSCECVLNNKTYSWITGACMLLPTCVLKKVGLFDKRYFMYWEDADLCVRIKNAGYSLRVAQDAIIYHSAGISSINLQLQRFEWHVKSQLIWVNKNYKFKIYGKFLVIFRHFFKSVITINFSRFIMLIKVVSNFLGKSD